MYILIHMHPQKANLSLKNAQLHYFLENKKRYKIKILRLFQWDELKTNVLKLMSLLTINKLRRTSI